jgi:threonyl-tRNA synthetase
VLGSLDFLSYIYGVFGFEYELELSTRPANALGSVELWKSAEAQLAQALDQFGKPWKINPGDGAFYGPKIDIKVYDAMKRRHQCGTVQLDFNLPKRFNLQYKTEEYSGDVKPSEEELTQYDDIKEKPCRQGFERPVIIHRAILGSIERMMAVLSEHYGGKWPFWLSPRQVVIVPVSEKFGEYAESVQNTLELAGFYTDVDKSNLTLNKKIRNAQVSQYNYIGVVGQEEVSSGSVDIRDRDENRSLGKFSVSGLIEFLRTLEPAISRVEEVLRARSNADVVEISYKLDLKDLNQRLSTATFLGGDTVGEEDWRIFKSLGREPDTERLPHAHRWYVHLKSL